MAQADFGRMEIELAEVEMPGLKSIHLGFGFLSENAELKSSAASQVRCT